MNPFTTALNSKLGMKLQGKSVVDNANDPASAYSMMKRKILSKGNAQTDAMNKALQKASANPKLTLGVVSKS